MQDVAAAGLLTLSGVPSMDTRISRLTQAKGSAGSENVERLQAAAREFEALFLSHMLSVMRVTIGESGLAERGLGADIYTELFDQEVARSLAERGALGISDLLMRRLSGQMAAQESGPGAEDITSRLPAAGQKTGSVEAEEVPDFRMPVQARISSAFGLRQDPFTEKPRLHQGIDIAAPAGMEVHAAAAGRVISSGYEQGYGNTVVMQHEDGYETRYAHLGTMQVSTGDQISERGVLGTVGSTGRSTGPHLHFEVTYRGGRVDPKQWIP
jgi:murein DD-endopeptidase MepM/ murein hydrolase activator NlpD